ncbi:MAG: hypothetical protein IJL42_03455 [Bacteroidales bacterium]|nr:hypothetical protein [Bacteroidales bacterium]
MKRIASIIFAGALALLASSCVKDELTMFDASKATAPVLNSFQIGEKEIVAEYTPGVFKQGFNDKIAPNHAFAIVSAGGKSYSKTLPASDKDGVLSIKPVNLAKALIALGIPEGSTTDVELAVRATMQDPSKDNGINGFVDSQGRINISGFEVVIPEVVGSPYADYTEASNWSIIGALSAYEINWDGDLNMWTDGAGNHVAAHVTLKADDEFKFRQDADWAVNLGGDFPGLDSEFGVAQDGPNIKVGKDGVYDIFVNVNDGVAWISEAFDPFPDYKESSNWSVIGALSAYGISWDGDLAMISDGSNHVALSVNLTADDEFKFRQDAAWTVNLGGDFGGLDTEFAVSQDGPNIKVGAEGVYDLYVNPAAGTAKITEAAGMKVSTKIGGDEPEPEPEPEPVVGWNIIGLNGDWENDIAATEDGGVWTAYITANDATEFKWRKDGGWDENFGGDFTSFGEPFEAVAGGNNIAVPAGFFKVVLDLNAGTITVFDDFEVWSLIGDFNGWAGDVDMTLADGKWVATDVMLTPGWKIRKNHGWDENRGGVFVAFGEPFEAVPGGDNVDCGEGKFTVVYDPEAETITISEGTVWSLIGNFNEWAGDVDMVEEGGKWVANGVELTPGWKIRKNHAWDENRGGVFVAFEEPFEAVPGGDNIDCGEGKFNVVYDPSAETITISKSVKPWGVIGDFNSWSADVNMTEVMPGIWVSDEAITTEGGWKIRFDGGWDVNRGGSLAQQGEFCKAVQGGDNINLVGTFKVVYNANNETIGTLGWGITGSIASAGIAWDKDIPMNLGTDGKWYSIPVALTAADELKIRFNAGWDENFGGSFAAVGEPFEAVAGGDNIKGIEDGTYMIVYDPENATLTVTKEFWGLIGNFNGWGGDVFMVCQGAGVWAAYGQTLGADWKIRQACGWDVNRGGDFVASGEPFEAVPGGNNISAGDGAIDIVYNAGDETITVTQ